MQKNRPRKLCEFIVVFLGLLMLSCLSASVLAATDAARRFTVRDSIAMNRFVNPDPDLQGETPVPRQQFSPDGRHAILVTQRGNVDTNQVEATIWVYDTEVLSKCLSDGRTCPAPHTLLRVGGTTTSLDNEDGVIADVRWLPNNEELAFLARVGGSRWRLYTVDLATETPHQLTPDDQNVGQYEMHGDLVLYSAAEPYRAAAPTRAFVATGRTLDSLLFANEFAPLRANQDQLWLIRNGIPTPLIDRRSGRQILINRRSTGTPKEVLSISPDGLHAVVNIAVTPLPSAWQKYRPGFFNYQLRAVPDEVLQYEYADQVPERYVLVDLQAGAATVMVDAPLGRGLGYFSDSNSYQAGVFWSKDGRQALLLNTFLPIGTEDAESGPAIVSYDVPSQRWTQVAPFKEARDRKWVLSDVSWLEEQREITLRYSEGGPAPETYRLDNGNWKLVQGEYIGNRAAPSQTPSPPPLHLWIRQDLNRRPQLFAALAESVARLVWDPNPQLQEFDLGEATLLRWHDAKGREVKGILFKPPNFKLGYRYPLVIEPRMYSEHAFIVDGIHVTAAAARALTAAEVLVLEAGEPNGRLRTGSGPEWFRSQMFAAIGGYEAAVEMLVSNGLVDRHRVGIFGFSRTCWNVMASLTQKPGLFAAATIADGLTYDYFGYLLEVDHKQVVDQLLAPYGAQPVGKGLQKWFERAPNFNLDRVNVPLRIEAHQPASLLGDNWGTYSILRILNRPVDLIMLPEASHVVSMPLDILESQQGDVDWFRFWLQDYEDPDTSKAEQYKRWRHLRELRDADRANPPRNTDLN